MWMPRPRFTLRWLMVAVGGLAIICACVVEFERLRVLSFRYQFAAQAHASIESRSRAFADNFLKVLAAAEEGEAELRATLESLDSRTAPDKDRRLAMAKENVSHWRSEQLRESNMAKYHGKLKEKYERAARYPWLPVEPDPPKPE